MAVAKTADDHLLDPEGTLGSKLPSSAFTLANSEVRSVIDSDRHLPFSSTFHCLAPCCLMRLLSVSIEWRNSPNFLPPN